VNNAAYDIMLVACM